MSKPLRLIVFDVDGTLIDSQNQIVAAMVSAFSAVGQPPPQRADILSIVGLSLDVAFSRLAPSLNAAVREKLIVAYKQAFVSLRQAGGAEASAPLFPGARQALQALSEDPATLLGVATGKARRGLDHAMASHDLAGFFATRQTADDHPSKPHPSMLIKALRDTGVRAGRAVMVGDTTFDVEMGRAAGYRTVGVAWGYHPARALSDAGADWVITDFRELAPLIEGWADG